MGFKFSDVISGAAKAGADIYGDKLKEQKAERSAFSSKMWNSNAMIQEGASNILKDRNKENQRLQEIRSTFMGRDPDLTKVQMEIIYRLPEAQRNELFNAPGSPLLTDKGWNISDLITILEEPEPLDPNLSLVERVQGATKDSPMDYSAFYGQSEHMTVEAEASIAKKQGAQIAAITGISMAKAQSLYSYNFKKVREIKHSINYVTRDYRTEQDFISAAADLTMKQQGVEGNTMLNTERKSKLIKTRLESLRTNYASSGKFAPPAKDGEDPMSTVGASVAMLSVLPGFESSFRNSPKYKEEVKVIISKAAMLAYENPTIGEAHVEALNIALPGRYGGDVPKDISKSEDNTYYWLVGKTADGTDQPGVMLGREIKGRAKRALTNKAKGENPQFAEWWDKDKTGSNKVVTKAAGKLSNTPELIAQQDKTIANMEELDESDSKVQIEKDFKAKLITSDANLSYFNELEGAPTAANSSKMVDAITRIIDEGTAEEIQDAIDKVTKMGGSSLGHSPIVSSAIATGLSMLGNAQNDLNDTVTSERIASISSIVTSRKDWTREDLKDLIKELNTFPSMIRKSDRVTSLKETLYAKLEVL